MQLSFVLGTTGSPTCRASLCPALLLGLLGGAQAELLLCALQLRQSTLRGALEAMQTVETDETGVRWGGGGGGSGGIACYTAFRNIVIMDMRIVVCVCDPLGGAGAP